MEVQIRAGEIDGVDERRRFHDRMGKGRVGALEARRKSKVGIKRGIRNLENSAVIVIGRSAVVVGGADLFRVS
jgi:hypothetical protein